MQGKGTQNDPYIITTAEELMTMKAYGSSGSYYALGNDIDLNGSVYASGFSYIMLYGAGLDGRDHRIRNIYKNCPGETAEIFRLDENNSTFTIKDLKLENIQISAEMAVLFSGTGRLVLRRCSLSVIDMLNAPVKTENNGIINSPEVEISAELCSFILWVKTYNARTLFHNAELDRCQIKCICDAYSFQKYISNNHNQFFVGSKLTDCCMFFELSNSESDNYLFLFQGCTLSNSYFIASSTGRSLSMRAYSCLYNGMNFFNISGQLSENMAGSYFKSLTQAQCKNAEYLRSIGFICGGGDS